MKKEEIIKKMNEIVATAEAEKRNLNEAEKAEFRVYENLLKDNKEDKMEEKKEELRSVKFADNKDKIEIYKDIANAMKEGRGLTLNGAGAIAIVDDLFSVMLAKREITQKYQVFYAENANQNIPVLNPNPARPAATNEGATNISPDSTAVLTGVNMITNPFLSTLPVSLSAAKFIPNLESKIKTLMADVYADALFYQSLNGTGGNGEFKGIFTANVLTNTLTCAATGAPTYADLLNLALKVADISDEGYIVLNSAFIASILADTNTPEQAKTEILLNKSIFGVPLYVSSYAPTTISGGSVVAVGFIPSKYAVALASQLDIEPLKKVGDANIYYQCTLFMNGMPTNPKNSIALLAKSSS